MSQDEHWTIRRLLEWTSGFLKERGSASPRLEAEVLLADALKLSRIELYVRFETVPTDEERAAFRAVVKRRAAGEPVAYLVGHKEFYSLDFDVSPDVLIPRPETEQLVLEGIEFFRARQNSAVPLSENEKNAEKKSPPAILDLGTGSGCVALALAKNLPDVAVTAVDILPEALEMARKNAKKLELADRIQLVKSDLFAALPSDAPFDLIVTNPPYVSRTEYESLEKMVRDYEPKIALLAGETGTEVIAKILERAPDFLRENGRLLVELSPMIADACFDLACQNRYFDSVILLKDSAGLRRVLSANRCKNG